MEWFVIALAVLVLGVAAVAGSGRLGEMPEAITDDFVPVLPGRPLVPSDLRDVQFGTAVRGYPPAQVDRLLAAAAAAWEAERR